MTTKSCRALPARNAAWLAIGLQAAWPSGAWAAAVASPAPPSDGATREALSGDRGGSRASLQERGVVVRPRLTQFVQGLSAGDGEQGIEYGGKGDLFVAADLGKLGFWNGLSMTLQADVNFGRNVNGRGGGLVPGRSRDNRGIGYYYDGLAQHLKDALAPEVTLRDEHGLELFYNFALTLWAEIGADLQIVRPGLGSSTAVVPGLRAVIRF